MSAIFMRQVDGFTLLDISKSFMDLSRTSEERCGFITESLDNGHDKIVLNFSQVDYCSHTALEPAI